MVQGQQNNNNNNNNMEKQMGGCMAGFFHIFDRHQILSGKRHYSAAKRLPPTVVATSTEPDMVIDATAVTEEVEKQMLTRSTMPSPEVRSPVPEKVNLANKQPQSPLPLPVFQGTKTSPFKICKEAPRLSLDSRATFDAKGRLKPREIKTREEKSDDYEKQRRSTSVVVRLMGLEPYENSESEQPNTPQPQLRRSASESRASLHYKFIDNITFQTKQTQQNSKHNASATNAFKNSSVISQVKTNRVVNVKHYNGVPRNARAEPAKAQMQKSYEFFPEPKQSVSIYNEIEKRLQMRGIDEPSKDLETLKQILEALQLKGLLHSNKSLNHMNEMNQRNFIHEKTSFDESPVVLMKPARSASPVKRGRIGSDSPPPSRPRRDSYLSGDISPRRGRRTEVVERNVGSQTRVRSSSSPTRGENSMRSPNRRRQLSVETQRRTCSDSLEQRRVSPVQSPRVGSITNRSPRGRKPTVEVRRKEEKVFVQAEDETSTVSESSISTDTDRSKVEEYKEGRSILERCDKLLNCIAEMMAVTELQPSPVSVLDSSFYKEESSPSPVMKRNLDLKDQLGVVEDDVWMDVMDSKSDENSEDYDFVYISDVVQASNYLPEESDIFQLLEKKQCLKGKDSSKVSRLDRKLIFDTITEILNQRRQLPPWKAVSLTNHSCEESSLQQIWSEFQKMRQKDSSEDLFEAISGVLKKDLTGDALNSWGDSPIEMSEAVLDIERLIFKDLIGETIRDLATLARCNQLSVLRRKLVF